MKNPSAGLLMYRHNGATLEVLLAHPGGPYWAKKDAGAWSLPKGEYAADEAPLVAAQREFTEETGFVAAPPFLPLGEARLASGKVVSAWACAGDVDPLLAVSNTFEMAWPPRSGKMATFPEVDRVAWFDLAQARARINPGQAPFLDALERVLGV